MTTENLQEKAKELKDSIAQSILKFKSDTGVLPNLDIKIIQTHQMGMVKIEVIVSVTIDL